jgi:hypothetical protein
MTCQMHYVRLLLEKRGCHFSIELVLNSRKCKPTITPSYSVVIIQVSAILYHNVAPRAGAAHLHIRKMEKTKRKII